MNSGLVSSRRNRLARWTDKADLRGRTDAPPSVLRTATSPSQVDGEESGRTYVSILPIDLRWGGGALERSGSVTEGLLTVKLKHPISNPNPTGRRP
jgi:hypothetical protein